MQTVIQREQMQKKATMPVIKNEVLEFHEDMKQNFKIAYMTLESYKEQKNKLLSPYQENIAAQIDILLYSVDNALKIDDAMPDMATPEHIKRGRMFIRQFEEVMMNTFKEIHKQYTWDRKTKKARQRKRLLFAGSFAVFFGLSYYLFNL